MKKTLVLLGLFVAFASTPAFAHAGTGPHIDSENAVTWVILAFTLVTALSLIWKSKP